MKRPVIFEIPAETEFRRAICWHDAAHKGQGRKFAKAVNNQVKRIALRPEDW